MRQPQEATVADRLARLRTDLSAGAGTAPPVMPLGLPALDSHLPGGGLVLGPPHEIAPAEPCDGIAALAFALALCARRLAGVPGEALIATSGHPLPYGHGLASLGLDPGRVLLLEAAGDREVFRALEAALHAGCLPAVVGLVGEGLPLKASRRLQLASEGSDPPLLLVLRPAGAGQPNGAATRWQVSSAPAAVDRFGGLHAPRWGVRLERCRNGRGGSWLVEWDSAAHRLHLPERLADDAAPARGSRP
ncbi:ImuA family protein [Methylobacterium sp. J-076]|uniref:ImuA family protein n=1 Tax=Methylobacterium sp. J-076 TaxID=2836655 RepID=UPI001FBAD62C|nr:ImuA protein [Methylobacterium sp. J-076]MCJ2015482.1 ImuA protein [Methylobacterium sp. J-076]